MKRLWGIRHIRYAFACWRFNRHMAFCRAVGLGFIPQQSDLDYLDGILAGKW